MAIKTTIAAGVLALGALVAAAPAQAGGSGFSVHVQIGQPYYGGYHYGAPQWHGKKAVYQKTLSPKQVRRILRSRGYSDIRYVDRRGSVYRARAEKNNKDFRLTINAYNGRIIDRDRV